MKALTTILTIFGRLFAVYMLVVFGILSLGDADTGRRLIFWGQGPGGLASGILLAVSLSFLPSILYWLFEKACSKNLPSLAKFTLVLGVDPDSRFFAFRTCLMEAIVRGNLRLVRMLLDACADVSHVEDFGMSALRCAVSAGKPELTEFLLKSRGYNDTPAIDGLTPLMSSAIDGQGKQVYLLLKYGGGKGISRCEIGAALVLARRMQHTAIAHYLECVMAGTASGDPAAGLAEACLAGDATRVKSLLSAGLPAEVLAEHGFPLLEAALRDGHVEVAGELIASGVDATRTTGDGKTLLLCAVEKRRLESVRFLLRTNGYTGASSPESLSPLQTAAEMRDAAMVRLLLESCPPGEPYKEQIGQELSQWSRNRKIFRFCIWIYGLVCAMVVYGWFCWRLEGVIPPGVAHVLDTSREVGVNLCGIVAALALLYGGFSGIVRWIVLAVAVACAIQFGLYAVCAVVCFLALLCYWDAMDIYPDFSMPWRMQKKLEPDDAPEKS